LDRRIAAWHQKRMLLQTQWRDAVEARFLAAATTHQADRQELVQFGQRPQQAMRLSKCAPEPNSIFPGHFDPVQDRNISRDAEIAGDVEHQSRRPVSASWVCRSRT